MMIKKLLVKSTIFLPALLLASCNFTYQYVVSGLVGGAADEDVEDIDDAGTYDVKIWVDDRIVDLTKSQIGEFIANNGDKYKINAQVVATSESVAAASMMQDVQSGADIFCFAQDQLSRLKVSGALAKLPSAYVNALTSEMSLDAISAAKVNGEVYAYPITSDNGYFLYYNKDVVSDEQSKNITEIIAACKAKGKKLYFSARGDGFYAASYFMGTGCYSSWQINSETGKFDSYKDNYNSEQGIIAAMGLKELDDENGVVKDSSASQLGDKAGAVVSGIWDYEAAYKLLGDKLGCAELPSFTVEGTSYHLSSFDGYKLLGVKPQVDAKKASVCRKIARFLVNESSQAQRFDVASWGPTNVVASQSEGVKSHPGLAALAAQHEYAKPQGQCPGGWFSAVATTAGAVKKDSTRADIETLLKKHESALADVLALQD